VEVGNGLGEGLVVAFAVGAGDVGRQWFHA